MERGDQVMALLPWRYLRQAEGRVPEGSTTPTHIRTPVSALPRWPKDSGVYRIVTSNLRTDRFFCFFFITLNYSSFSISDESLCCEDSEISFFLSPRLFSLVHSTVKD